MQLGRHQLKFQLQHGKRREHRLRVDATDESAEGSAAEQGEAEAESTADADATAEAEPASADPTIQEGVIYEGNGVTISITGIEKGLFGYEVGVYIENSSSLNLGFNAHSYAINGVMSHNNIYEMGCDVSSGKKANATLGIYYSTLEEIGVEDTRNLEINIWAYDNDRYTKEFETGQLYIATSADDGTCDTQSGTTIYDSDGIKVDFLSNTDYSCTYVLTNNTGQYVDIDVENLNVNGYTSSDVDYDPYSEQVLDGCQFEFTIKPTNDFLQTNGIDSIETMGFNIKYRPLSDYFDERTTDFMGVSFN